MSTKRFGKNEVVTVDWESISFSLYTKKELRAMCPTKIVTPITLDAMGHPVPGGLYDTRMGPMADKSEPCGTCRKNVYLCRGHFGYVELPLPVVNPMFFKNILQILKISCLECYTVQFPVHVRHCLQLQMKLLKCGLTTEALEVGEKMSEAVHAMNKDHDDKKKKTKEKTDAASLKHLFKKFRPYEKLANETMANLNGKSPTSRNKETVRNEILYDLLRSFTAHRNCINCKKPITKISVERNNKVIIRKLASPEEEKNEENMEDEDEEASKLKKVMSGGVKAYQEEYLTPDESRKYMRAIWEKDGDILKCLLPVLETVRTEEGESPVDCLYLEVVPVLPPMCRPASFVDDRMSDHPQTQAYKAVVQSAVLLGIMIKVVKNRQNKNGGIFNDLPADTKNLCEVMPGKTPTEKLNFAWENLQYSVNALMDKPPHYRSDGLGLKQIIEKKQGIIRMNMMGKRVNFSARSVITPDPYIRVDEVGIPEAFAKTLTYPTPVTHWNVEELRKVVVNGPDVYPGANLIELEDGTIRRINPADPIQREGIAKTLLTPCIKGTVGVKKVHRHMRNGDVVLLNRQPTLHRPSLMAHKVRILGGGEKVLRLHYANCKAYNADFDGDEMNVHFPQNEVARCEAYQLANVASHYVVPKDGTPLSGLIQDHVIAGVNLSMRGRFFTRPEYDQLVYQGLSFKIAPIKVLPPAILKPRKLWSGKQVLSTIILNLIPEGKAGIRLTSTSKIGAKEWEVEKPRQWLAGGTPFKDAQCMSETEVVIRNGELLCGVLDKAHYGSTPYGLVHCFYELYGGTAAVKLLSAFSRMFTAFMSTHIGFTLSVQDILVKAKANRKRRKVIEKLRDKGAEACAKALGLPPDTPCDELAAAVRREGAADPQLRNLIDREYKLLVNPYTQKITKICMSGLVSKFPKNNLQLMIQSGAKGASVNAIQISCLLGQIELEGKRPPLMISGKSLPNFPVNDLSPRAGGFIDQRFMTGISPPEFFFHCMAGREGLIDTAVKTSRSGYLQRCLVKHLEGLHVGYDMTVRDSDGSVVQFLYGEDGMDTSKVQFLNKKQLPFLEENADIVVDEQVLEEFKTDDDKRAKKVKKHQKKISSWREKFGDPFAKNYEGAFGKLAGEISKKFPGKANPEVYREAWAQVDDEIKNKLRAECPKCPDPVTSIYRPDHHFGSLSEHQADLLDDYCRAKSKKQRRTVENMYKLKSSQSLCSPGEPVGLLAAQSVGEPSTQMTLNTFHFAGRGEMNVTLGIPRLREILMMASKNIKTPSMEIPFKEDVPNLEMEAETLKKTLTRVVLCEVLHKIEVTILQEIRPVRQHKYTLEFHFLPHDLYEDRFKVKPKAVIKHVSKKFFGEMFAAIRKFAKGQKVSGIMMEETKKNARSNRNKDDEDEEDEEGGADDETATSSSKNKSTSKNNMAAASDDDTSEDEEGEEDEEDARFRNRHEERTKEQEPDDEEEIEMADQDGDDYASDLEIGEDGYELNSSKNGKKASSREEEEDRNEEENTVLNSYSYIKEYTYDKKGYLWCKVVFALPITIPRLTLTGMLCKVATSSVIWEVPKINKAITYKKDGRLMLRTDGVNILEMCKYSRLLDLNKLHCNDIYHVSQTYGIEAARRVIVKEVQDVFAVYGIEVDPRHLLLVADYMCFNGTYEPLSRKCMEGGASPFQQMSFESHLSFLKSAVVGGKRDDLTNPSSGLIAGKPVEIGTNLCDVMIDIEKIVRQNRK